MSGSERRSQVAAVTGTLAELLRTFEQGRAAVLADVAEGVESTSHVLLRVLQEEGPLRSGALAETLGLDPSTVSRRVATLVKDGLVERQADPDDGRAWILVPTAAGRREIDESTQRRIGFFDQILADWAAGDVAELDRLLARFTADYTAAHQTWMSQRRERRGHRPSLIGGSR